MGLLIRRVCLTTTPKRPELSVNASASDEHIKHRHRNSKLKFFDYGARLNPSKSVSYFSDPRARRLRSGRSVNGRYQFQSTSGPTGRSAANDDNSNRKLSPDVLRYADRAPGCWIN